MVQHPHQLLVPVLLCLVLGVLLFQPVVVLLSCPKEELHTVPLAQLPRGTMLLVLPVTLLLHLPLNLLGGEGPVGLLVPILFLPLSMMVMAPQRKCRKYPADELLFT